MASRDQAWARAETRIQEAAEEFERWSKHHREEQKALQDAGEGELAKQHQAVAEAFDDCLRRLHLQSSTEVEPAAGHDFKLATQCPMCGQAVPEQGQKPPNTLSLDEATAVSGEPPYRDQNVDYGRRYDRRVEAFNRASGLRAVDCKQGEGEQTGAELIALERERQVNGEGWTPEHDDNHDGGELEQAAACYLRPGNSFYTPGVPPPEWPFEAKAWKPTEREPVRALIKAGALIAAEIDRRLRAASPSTPAHKEGEDG